MKVLLINGSPHKNGCTYTALTEIEKELNKENIETEIFQIGNKPIGGCTACGGCSKTGKCVFGNDTVNNVIEKIKDIDGLIVGSPVYYASANGSLISLLDRVFYAASDYLKYKPAASIASARRAGTTTTLDELNKYFTINNMPIVSSQYWNMVHGNNAEEVIKDLEGMQIMRTLGKNMAWLLKCIEAGKKQGINIPEKEEKIITNFIR
ncbi:flavodoxin family protein [Sedimentibacter sp. zth1]|uniref:flavodoxin family protein n=1 Tax=Sedimentibacter sp. zth1 TaxID=2816908 RepID=UPI001A918472|nr:flavodoxin family protein [Sedimentibacter sp. zth1]QSX05516.1 flavodoxin family protein [Sedimentibacter sp. zth1]